MTLEEWLRDKVIIQGQPLRMVVEDFKDDAWGESSDKVTWFIDVLSDGTAVTYSYQ